MAEEAREGREPSLGAMLRTAREAQGLTVQEAADATRIRAVLLEAMEAEEWDRLPARIYAKGQLRLYARFLGLDPEEVMTLFGEAGRRLGRLPSLSEALARAPLVSPDLAAGLVLVAVILGGGWLAFEELVAPSLSPAAPPAPTEEPPVEEPSLRTPPANSDVPAPLIVEFQILSRTWLQVTTDGELVFEGLLDAGATQTWAARKRIGATMGDPAAIRVLVNGEDQGPLGIPGQPLTLEWGVDEPPGLGPLTPEAEPIPAPE